MSHEEIKTNYHSFIGEIKSVFDPINLKMGSQDVSTWRGQAFIGPLKEFGGAFRSAGALGKIGDLHFI
ncbi:hypothetical protein EDM59_26480 [Brevibacillus nitrificans]|uniref:Uncharacterized protein n=1 Tax=Brevibacillus nitrificans TaxID=651560 RepID=A0A3M8CYJ6_9BACL|nr:hypothetical protein EDM59_26480 [Brevibacillus nitrificans]